MNSFRRAVGEVAIFSSMGAFILIAATYGIHYTALRGLLPVKDSEEYLAATSEGIFRSNNSEDRSQYPKHHHDPFANLSLSDYFRLAATVLSILAGFFGLIYRAMKIAGQVQHWHIERLKRRSREIARITLKKLGFDFQNKTLLMHCAKVDDVDIVKLYDEAGAPIGWLWEAKDIAGRNGSEVTFAYLNQRLSRYQIA